MKGLLFAGDSFTWGQGLYFYSDLPRIKQPPQNSFNSYDVTEAQIRYKDTKRFARVVANHFETFDVSKMTNGGSDVDTLSFIDDVFTKDGFFYEDFDYLIFQTTHFIRSAFDFMLDGHHQQSFIMDRHSYSHSNYQNFDAWMRIKKYSIDDYLQEHVEQVFNKIKNKLIKIESNGVSCKIICWDDDYVDLIEKDDFLKNRFIKIKYDGVEYNNFKDLTGKNNHLLISGDIKNLGNHPPQDFHLSLEAQGIIAENIIKVIEKSRDLS
jgi:hypothetical protein